MASRYRARWRSGPSLCSYPRPPPTDFSQQSLQRPEYLCVDNLCSDCPFLNAPTCPRLRKFRHGVSPQYGALKVNLKRIIDAPAAIGPYEQAIKANGFVFVSGCIPLDPASMEIVDGGIEEQTTQVFKNLRAVVEASGSSLDKVVKTTVGHSYLFSVCPDLSQVFLKSMNDFVAMNGVYSTSFGSHKPARSAVEVSRLPKDVLVEVECIALAT